MFHGEIILRVYHLWGDGLVLRWDDDHCDPRPEGIRVKSAHQHQKQEKKSEEDSLFHCTDSHNKSAYKSASP